MFVGNLDDVHMIGVQVSSKIYLFKHDLLHEIVPFSHSHDYFF